MKHTVLLELGAKKMVVVENQPHSPEYTNVGVGLEANARQCCFIGAHPDHVTDNLEYAGGLEQIPKVASC